jgi:hypothetical protein
LFSDPEKAMNFVGWQGVAGLEVADDVPHAAGFDVEDAGVLGCGVGI